jgi:hypothetical protein
MFASIEERYLGMHMCLHVCLHLYLHACEQKGMLPFEHFCNFGDFTLTAPYVTSSLPEAP